jgi:hypothetical protein
MKSIEKHAFMAQVANSIIFLSFSTCTCHLSSLFSFFCNSLFLWFFYSLKKAVNCFSNLGLITDITPNLTVFNSTGFPPISVKTFGTPPPPPLFLYDEICKFALSKAKPIILPCRCFAFRNALVFYFLPWYLVVTQLVPAGYHGKN